MRFKGRMELEQGIKPIDILPLINVLFLLLLFFMVASSLPMQPGVKVNLPKALTSEAIKYGNIEILVNSENITYLNGRLVNRQELGSFFKEAAKRNQTVLIKADTRASLGKVVEVWDMCRSSGISQVNIATNQD